MHISHFPPPRKEEGKQKRKETSHVGRTITLEHFFVSSQNPAITNSPHLSFLLPELNNLVELDLSSNFLDSVPVEALSRLDNLRFLNLGSNKIRVRRTVEIGQTREFVQITDTGVDFLQALIFLAKKYLKKIALSLYIEFLSLFFFPDHQGGRPPVPVLS